MDEWMKFSHEQLEKEYSPSRWSKRMSPDNVVTNHIKILSEASREAKSSLKGMLDIEFGSEKMDLFYDQQMKPGSPIFAYIHGGYWQALDRASSSFGALPICQAGAIYAAIEYTIAPVGSIESMVQQVADGLSYLVDISTKNKFGTIYVCGHSAGAHLTAMALTCLPESCFEKIGGVILVSGIYDIRPIVHTYINDPLRLSEEDAIKLSPIFEVENVPKSLSVMVVVAEHDSPEFHRQSQEIYKLLLAGGNASSYLELKDHDHFDVIESLSSSKSAFTEAVLKFMKLRI